MSIEIKKGTRLEITHCRKGTFMAKAKRDFDISEEWWPVVVDDGVVIGMSNDWERGEDIPCRNSLVSTWKQL